MILTLPIVTTSESEYPRNVRQRLVAAGKGKFETTTEEENFVNLGTWLLENDQDFLHGSWVALGRNVAYYIVAKGLLLAQLFITYHFFINTIQDTIAPIKV